MNQLRSIKRLLVMLPHRIAYGHGPALASALRKRWAKIKNPDADIRFGAGVYAGPGFSLHIPGRGSFEVGDGTEFRRGFRAEVVDNGQITIGSGCYLTYDVIIACSTKVTIGDRVGVGQASFIADGSHRYRDPETPFLEQGYDFREIAIADDVQIHSKVSIMNSIGERSVVGANAVITKPMPAYSLIAGVPAKAIDYFGPGPERLAEPTG